MNTTTDSTMDQSARDAATRDALRREARERSVLDLFRDLLNELTALLRIEGRLVRTELSEKVGEAARGLTLVVAGAVLLIPALVILLGAGVAALVNAGYESHWAALIVGGVALIVGIVLAFAGSRSMRVDNLKPRRTIENLQRDVTVARNHLRNDHEVQRTT
jgi:putative superfamily III holin-X